MKYIDEYRNHELVETLIKKIRSTSKKEVKLMEVCGGHTMAIRKFGIPHLLPENIKLLSGPGCPVCVTEKWFIDKAVSYSKRSDIIITSYGDLIRVPGSFSSLEKEKAKGGDIRIVYSPLDALDIASENPSKKTIFLGIGFETTSPATAITIHEAEKQNISNFFLLSAHKIMPPAMKTLIYDGVPIDGYICPGHVSAITGSEIYRELVHQFGIGCVVSGFEPTDLLQTILMLVKQIEQGKPKLEIQYKRIVKPEGNIKAKKLLEQVFVLADDNWRGIGIIPQSGFRLKKEFEKYDAEKAIKIEVPFPKEENACICGEILKGLKRPDDCPLFKNKCTPEKPIGACMVSSEGACQAFFKYQ